jgi:hypothetical protein
MPPKTKNCPYCSKLLRETAKVCLFCGRNLEEVATPSLPVETIKQDIPTVQPIPSSKNMNIQKWEYAELEVTIGGPLSGTWCEGLIYQVGKKHEKTQGNFGELLAGLGDKGWELVAGSARIETGFSNKHKINYILKRPKEVAPP